MTDSMLVTGGAGFIGSSFARHMSESKPRQKIVVLDLLTYAGNLANLQGVEGLVFEKGSIADQPLVESLIEKHSVTTIVNFAAESHVDRSISGPDIFIETNINGTHSLLKAARNQWLGSQPVANHRFHHVSTDEVYGSLQEGEPPFTEQHPYAPNSPYSASKAGSDHLVRAWHHTYGLQTTVSNCSNNYGPRQFPEKLIPLALTNLLLGETVPVYGDGRNIRDWIFVDDHSRGIELILHQGRPGEVYNLGGENELRNLFIVETLCDKLQEMFASDPALAGRFPNAAAASGNKFLEQVQFVEDRPGHDWRYAIDSNKAISELGYQPATPFEAGIESTIRWYLDNEPWWRSVLDGSYRQISL